MTRPTTPRRFAGLAIVALLFIALPAAAVTATMGNPVIDRGGHDTWPATLIDMNNPAPFDGYFTQVDYYVDGTGTVQFVVVDATDTVTWVSDVVRIEGEGPRVLSLDTPVWVSAGSNIGYYTPDIRSAIVSDSTGATMMFTAAWSSVPDVGETLSYDTAGSPRTNSISVTVKASSPDVCKNGGWRDHGYRNQGLCIASVVADPRSGH